MRSTDGEPDWDRQFDDIDSIVHAKRERAVGRREWSVGGLLRMLEHGAAFEEETYGDLVVDPEMLDRVAEGRVEGGAGIAEEVVAALRERLASARGGERQRALYAIVRLVGPEAPEVRAGLADDPASRLAVLWALCGPVAESAEGHGPAADLGLARGRPRFAELPVSLLPELARLVESDAPRVLVSALVRIPSEEVASVLLRALERDELRQKVLEELCGEDGRDRRFHRMPDALVERFERAASIIDEARKGGYPHRVELVVAAAIAAMSGPHAGLARRTLEIFDLVPGLLPKNEPGFGDGNARAQAIRQRLMPFCRLLEASVDLLDEEERAKLASHLTGNLPERFGAAASAWVRLPVARAKRLAAGWEKGDRALDEARWEAAGRAYAALSERPAELASMFPDAVVLGTVSATDQPPAIDAERLVSMVRKARSPVDLRAALELAAKHGAKDVLPVALEKLRDGPFRIDAALEAALLPLVDDDNDSFVRDEIDGENPFRDRREALERVLAARSG